MSKVKYEGVETRKTDGRLDRRLSRLEAVVEGLASDVDKVIGSISHLGDAVIARGETNWSVLGTWAAVLLVVIGMGGSGYIRDLDRLEHRQEILLEHISNDDNKVLAERIEHNNKRIELIINRLGVYEPK